MPDKFYVTTPIYYVNDVPHLGAAYTNLACDVLARFNRLDGKDVLFVTGTDEHGQKVEKAAIAAGVDPQSFTDKVSQSFRNLAATMNYSNDDFIRTTGARHKEGVRHFWEILKAKGQIYLGSYAGWYAMSDEAYYAEDELTITSDGKRIAPSGKECTWVEEPSYFFKLSEWGDRLLEYYDSHPDFIMPVSRRNEVVSFVKSGLTDLSISRTTFKWGIPVPGEEGHVMYVWVDALTYYLTALGYPDQTAERIKFWPPNVQMVGKDILRFHAVYWPALLLAAGLPLPHRIFAHGWWTAEGQKMSKSIGNVIAPADLVNTYGLDQTRYFLLRAFPFGNDGDFSRKAMIERINGDLANGIGNLAQRTLSLVAKNCGGVLPAIMDATEEDKSLLTQAEALVSVMRTELQMQAFHKALDAVFALVSEADGYIDKQAPWSLKKTDPARMNTVLGVLYSVLRTIGICLQPFMPDTMAKLLDQLAVEPGKRDFAALGQGMKSGIDLPPPQGIFPRYVEAEEPA